MTKFVAIHPNFRETSTVALSFPIETKLQSDAGSQNLGGSCHRPATNAIWEALDWFPLFFHLRRAADGIVNRGLSVAWISLGVDQS